MIYIKESMMKRFVAILYLVIPLFIQGQNKYVDINEITVTTHRTPTIYSETSRIVTIIHRDEIANAPVQSINELLEYVANVDNRNRGIANVQSDVSIRGGSFEQTLILFNGIPVNNPQTGHHNMDLPVDIKNVERIEILEGPAARIYGPNAFSGAINIITRNGRDANIHAGIAGGAYGFFKGNISAAFPSGEFTNYASVTKNTCDGYTNNTDFDISNMFFQTSHTSKLGSITAQGGHTVKKFGANSFYSEAFPEQYERTKSTFIALKMKTGDKLRFKPNVFWQRHTDHFRLRRDDPAFYTNNHLTDVYGANFNLDFETAIGKSAIGTEFRREEILSNILGNEIDKALPVPDDPGRKFTHGISRNNINVFFEHQINYRSFDLSLGLLAHWNSKFNWNYYPGIDFSYQPVKYVKLFATINQTLRMPTFTDLYYESRSNLGNPYLIPEKAINYEIGLRLQHPAIRAHFAVFHRDAKNIIDWIKDPDNWRISAQNDTLWETRNITELQTTGFEFSSKIRFSKLFHNTFPLKSLSVHYSYINVAKQSHQYISKYALDYLRHKLIVSTHHKIYGNLSANWNIVFQDRAGSYYAYGRENDYKPFCLLDCRLKWDATFFNERLETGIYMEVSNVFDIRYRDIGIVQMPERWIRIGADFDIPINK